jgi:uncharacterized protein (TIGR02231 family)
MRFTELSEKKLALTRKDVSTREELDRINEQLGEASKEDVKPTGEIMVQVMAKEPLVAKFKVSYLVRLASWSPEFDLRLDDISQPLELSRRAKISQNSGEEWKDIRLTLSTGNPNESGTEPRISTWYLGGYVYKYQSSNTNNSSSYDHSVIDKPIVGYSFNGRVNGRVYSTEDGQPLAGAPIVVKGTTNGTITDMDGNIPLNAKLEVN